jgi:hypothetical protein
VLGRQAGPRDLPTLADAPKGGITMSQLELSRQAAASYALSQAIAERKAEAKRGDVRQRASVWQRVRAAILRPA